jgi:nucleoside-diphosphate-sugar epimerase
MNKVIITGASGLVGSHIAELFISKDIRPLCMIRKNSSDKFLRSIGAEIVYGDVTNFDSLSDVFSNGAEFIIHTAAKVGDWGKYDDFYNVNVTGSLNILKAAKLHNIKNVIITGSVSCFGEESSSVIKTEEHPYNSHYEYFLGNIFPSGLNFYRDTKAEACSKAKEFAGSNSINLTVLHPAWIYGEREFHSGFYDYLKTVKSGLHWLPGSKKNKFHTIYVRDLAMIYYLAYTRRLQGINEFNAVSPAADYQYKLFDLFCSKAGYSPLHRLPKAVTYPIGLVTELFYTVFKIKSVPLLSRGRVNTFYDNIEYSSEKLTNELGFNPAYSLEESIGNTIRWYKENRYL